MMQRHIFSSILLMLSVLSTNAMNPTMESFLQDPRNHNLTLNKAKEMFIPYFNDEKQIVSQVSCENELEKGILLCITLPQDLQKVMLCHLGFVEQNVQDDFINRPLPQAFEWLAQCRNKCFLPSPARYLLNYEQYHCWKQIILNYASESNPTRYVDADSHEDIPYNFVLITPKEKQILLSLPQAFMDDTEEVQQALLQGLHIAEKPSIATKLFCTPLSMIFHSVRTMRTPNSFNGFIQELNPYHSRLAFSVLTLMGIENFFKSYNKNLLSCVSMALCVHIIANDGKCLYRMFFDPQADLHNNYNTCIVKHSPIRLQDIPFFALTTTSILLQKYLNNMPLSTIFSGIAITLAPFIAYDCCKYGVKYGIKVQSAANFIQNHAKTKNQFCALI